MLLQRACDAPLLLATIALGVLLLWPGSAPAGPIQTIGAGSAVSSVDRAANFDALTEGTNLSGYTEGGLGISVAAPSYQSPCCPDFPSIGPFPGAGFSGGFFYPWGGSFDPTHITAADGLDLFAIELNVGSGFYAQGDVHIYWEAYDDLVLVGSGSLDVAKGTVLGFRDPSGFDELRIAALQFSGATGFGVQALALDNVVAQLDPPRDTQAATGVPVPRRPRCSWAWAPSSSRFACCFG